MSIFHSSPTLLTVHPPEGVAVHNVFRFGSGSYPGPVCAGLGVPNLPSSFSSLVLIIFGLTVLNRSLDLQLELLNVPDQSRGLSALFFGWGYAI